MLRQIAPSIEEAAQLDARFGIAQDTLPEADALKLQAEIRYDIRALARLLSEKVEPSRELSTTLTKLEEALMWAGKAIFS